MTTTRTHPPSRSGRLGMGAVAAMLLAPVLLPASASAASVSDHPLLVGQWVAFDSSGTDTFTFATRTPVVVRVTDAFCRGDRFRALDHGLPVLTTADVPVDADCDEQPFATSGPEGWHNRGYSRGRVTLPPGRHRIRIRSLRSPFGAGTGFIEAVPTAG